MTDKHSAVIAKAAVAARLRTGTPDWKWEDVARDAIRVFLANCEPSEDMNGAGYTEEAFRTAETAPPARDFRPKAVWRAMSAALVKEL